MKLPIDTGAMTFLCASGPEPVIDFESKQPKTDESGETLYSVQLVALSDGTAEIIAVKTAGKPADSVLQGTNVKVSELVASPWSMGDRSGVAFRAGQIEAVSARSTS